MRSDKQTATVTLYLWNERTNEYSKIKQFKARMYKSTCLPAKYSYRGLIVDDIAVFVGIFNTDVSLYLSKEKPKIAL